MTRSIKIISAAVLSLMFLFTSIGYAALTDSLQITGNADIRIPYGLFITNIETTSASDVDMNTVSFLDYSTTVDATISKNPPTGNGWNQKYPTGVVKYKITVFNNTEFRYSYRDIYYQSGLYNNNSIGSSSNSKIKITEEFPNGRSVDPGKTLTFYVTYTISPGSRNNNDSNKNYRTLVNYQFGINVDRVDQAVNVVHNKFLNILNTDSTYLQLIDALDNKYDGVNTWTSNYIGNVTDANDGDSVLVNQLFAGHLQITVGNDEYPATVLIKHEPLDGNELTGDDYTATNVSNGGSVTQTGCEIALYLTIDPLDDRDAGKYVPVYVSVFTCDRDANGNKISDWYPIGDMYAGTANVVTYDGGNGGGSFVTDNWISDFATYTPVEGYTYTVNQGTKIGGEGGLVRVVDPNAIAAFQGLLDRAKAVIDNRDYAGTGIIAIEQLLYEISDFYTINGDGSITAVSTTTRVRLIPIMKELSHAVEVAEAAIEESKKDNS